MRSSRPMRCSATSGLQGRSNSTMRRQNSKFRPSPPHSVETRRLGPPDRRNWATSMSRRAEDSSSWKTPVASWARRLSSVRSHSSVSRWATKTSVFSPGLAPRGRVPGRATRGAGRPRPPAPRGARGPRRRGRGEPGERRPRRARGARDRPSAGGRARGARGRPHRVDQRQPLAAQPSVALDRAGRRGAAARRCPRVASSSCRAGRGSGRARRASKVSALGEVRRAAAAGAGGRSRARRRRAGSR